MSGAKRVSRYPVEVRERAVRMVFEHQHEYPSQWKAIESIAEKLSINRETLRGWVRRAEVDGPAARIEAMSRLAGQNTAMWWAEWFIILLFIALETAPVFVKLISSKGPYDNLLKVEEYRFASAETEELAKINAEIKARNSGISQIEQEYITDRLDTALKNS